MIEVENLVKRYGGHLAVDHLSFTVEKGCVCGFLGPNGAGKSTTMNMMTGYLAPTEGEVRVDGHSVTQDPAGAKACIGYLPEQPPLYVDMTVREYLEFAAGLKRIPRGERAAQLDRILEMTRTADVSGRLIRNLSKGYRQRVGLAQALIGFPHILILDEPTVGLDPKQILEIRALIRELAQEHTVILSSHILSEVQEVCDHIFIIHHGRLVAQGTPAQLERELAGTPAITLLLKAAPEEGRVLLSGVPGVAEVAPLPCGAAGAVPMMNEIPGADLPGADLRRLRRRTGWRPQAPLRAQRFGGAGARSGDSHHGTRRGGGAMTAVYKRELRSYFTSMVGYVFIAILIFFVGIYFMAYNLFGGSPSFGYVLLSCTIIFMVAVPILTMRSMAEDRRGKTDQLLLTSPVSLTGIVLGKYLAMVTVLLVPILLICFCPLIIAMNGSATLTADYAAILAFFCMGCVYIAVGMFVSALTESQIIAAVGTFAALLALYLWTDLVSFLPDSLAQLLSSFDFQGVLDNFAYYSVFDLGGLLLYLSMAAVFVFLTVQVLQRRKGITSAATTAVVLAIAVVVNLVVGQLPSDLVERDISDNSLYTVSDTSVDYLSALERDVELVVLASEDTTDQRITKFLHNYAALSGHLSLSFVDPVEHPSALTEYEADQNTVVVRCADTGRQRVVPFSDILVADLMSYYTYGTYTYSEFDAEGQLTSAVDYVTSDNSHILYLAENHGESALGGSVTDAISKANLSTSTVSLLLDNGVPDDCSLLVFNQPQTDLSADEAQMVRDYLEGGGQVMILLTRTDLANFNAILADYGLAMAQPHHCSVRGRRPDSDLRRPRHDPVRSGP